MFICVGNLKMNNIDNKSILGDIFRYNSLQNIEEMAHELYECMSPHLMKQLGKIGNKHPDCPTSLMKVDAETYSAMLCFANRVLDDRYQWYQEMIKNFNGDK